jgi:hypothetical protein
MKIIARVLLTASLFALPASSLLAQTMADPSGHWAGAIHVPPFNGAPAREIAIEVDLAKKPDGALAGTFAQPAEGVKGLPLSSVAVNGKAVTFELKATAGGGLFHGTLADGAKMSGEFTTAQGGFNIPFDLARTGDAVIAPAPKGGPIGKELEGTWNGTIEAGGKQERLVLILASQPDGTSTGTIRDLDGSNVDIPVAVTQKGSNVTVDIAVTGASYAAVLSPSGELAGTWSQSAITLPLTFKRVTK